jgi:predicted deacylase
MAALAPVGLVAGSLPALTSQASDAAYASAAQVDHDSAVIGTRVLGKSVRDRRIVAYHLGEKGEPKVVLIATMHGNEGAPRRILQTLRDGKPIHGIDLWVVPTYNPDGLARGTRKNAHGVDLNRNYPYHWADLDGNYESGSGPASEPETRAMMKFLRDVRPSRILSFHQPLYGVDTDTKNKPFARRVARKLDLPAKRFDCGGVCHGTMTGWYNDRFKGAALTVEYAAHPTRRMMRVLAPRRVLSIWGAWRGDPEAEPVP